MSSLPDTPEVARDATPIPLARLRKGARGVVVGVQEPAPGASAEAAAVLRRLVEVGFVAGESFEIIEEARPGGDPIAVRLGGSVFALRRQEASAVLVRGANGVGGVRAP